MLFVAPLPVTNLTSRVAADDNTTTAVVSWINPILGEWSQVTIGCDPQCAERVVKKPGNSTIVSGLTPGRTYGFRATVLNNCSFSSAPSLKQPDSSGNILYCVFLTCSGWSVCVCVCLRACVCVCPCVHAHHQAVVKAVSSTPWEGLV